MKIRTGFVSNSSSSSFVISKSILTDKQIRQIVNFREEYKNTAYKEEVPDESYLKYWSIVEEDNIIRGSTNMDNFGMYDYFIEIGVNVNKANFRE